jgi:hypothetical protein
MTVQAFGLTVLLAAVTALVPTLAPDWLTEQVLLTAHRPTDVDPRCSDADRAAVARLQPLLDRTAAGDGYVVDRALHGLDIARMHCRDGRVETGLGNYAWLERWIEAND